MLACKGIFARPSIPQTHLWCVEASAVKNCLAILPADIIPRSKNVCLHGHFREAVNAESVPQARLGAKPPEAAKQHPTKTIIPRSKNVCSHRHFCEAVNCADAPLVRGGVSREELHSNSSRGYYTSKRKCVLAQTFLRGRQCHIVQHTMLHGRRHAADSLHLQGVM